MAEELTSQATAPEQPSTPVEQPVPASQPAPQPEQPESVQPTQSGLPDNWQDDPKFKDFQRNYGKTLDTVRQENAQLKQQSEQIQRQYEEMITRDMTDDEKWQHERQKLIGQVERVEQEKSQIYQEYAKSLALSEIARETGVPLNTLEDADNPDEAWKLAYKASIAQVKADAESKYKDALASQPSNTPDLGPATTATPSVSSENPHFETLADVTEYYRRQWDEFDE